MSKKKNLIARSGNFEITLDKGAEYNYLRIKAVNGFWGLTFREDNEMYGKILLMTKDKQYKEVLEQTILYYFMATSILIDGEFAKDYLEAVNRMAERHNAAKREPTEQEEVEAVDEAETLLAAQGIINKQNNL